jgi:hypothetical protein
MAKQTKKPTSKQVEELKKLTDDKKSGEAKIKPMTSFRSILTLVK